MEIVDIQALAEECRPLADKGARWNLGELELFRHNLRMWAWYDRKEYADQCGGLIETLKRRVKTS